MQSYRSLNTCVSNAYIFTESVTGEMKVVFCNFNGIVSISNFQELFGKCDKWGFRRDRPSCLLCHVSHVP